MTDNNDLSGLTYKQLEASKKDFLQGIRERVADEKAARYAEFIASSKPTVPTTPKFVPELSDLTDAQLEASKRQFLRTLSQNS